MKISRITATEPRLNWLSKHLYEGYVSSIVDPRISNGSISEEAVAEIKAKVDGYAKGETTPKGYNVHIKTFIRTVAKLYGSELAGALSSRGTRKLSEDDF